jgi:hypothetical protein
MASPLSEVYHYADFHETGFCWTSFFKNENPADGLAAVTRP